jgi:hypothetical protein
VRERGSEQLGVKTVDKKCGLFSGVVKELNMK